MVDGVVSGMMAKLDEMGIVDPKEKAKKLKDEANQFFKDENFEAAIDLYTQAIHLDPSIVTYYSNRSLAYINRELYGLALEDADVAISIDPAFAKAYFRRASANMAMGKFKLALKDYEKVRDLRPNDKDVQKKFTECQKIVRAQAFARAIACDHGATSVAESIKIDDFPVEESYDGPRMDGAISVEFMTALVETFKAQKKLHTKYAYKILLAIKEQLQKLPSLIDIRVPDSQKFTICGDVHGQFYDLCHIFELNGIPSETNPYLFNGDFVDRGSFSVETIFTLFGFKLLYPNHFHLSRGNHESDVMNRMYGFEGEVKTKYSEKMVQLFTEIFNFLPLCHVINDKIFVCHGGLPKEDGVTLAQIRSTNRFRQPPEEGVMCDLLWSDPMEARGRSPSKRGVGCQFGPDISERFLEQNGLSYIVRSHEVKPEGWEEHHDGKCYTIFSAPNYCDTIGNKGAFITIKGNNLHPPKITTFEASTHPNVKPMTYASSLFSFLS